MFDDLCNKITIQDPDEIMYGLNFMKSSMNLQHFQILSRFCKTTQSYCPFNHKIVCPWQYYISDDHRSESP